MLKTTRFDAADYLTTPEARAEYLTAAFETGDLEFIRDSLGVVVKATGVAKVSKHIGVTREGLYKSLGKSGNPEFDTVMRIVRALGLTLSAKRTAGRKPSKRKAV